MKTHAPPRFYGTLVRATRFLDHTIRTLDWKIQSPYHGVFHRWLANPPLAGHSAVSILGFVLLALVVDIPVRAPDMWWSWGVGVLAVVVSITMVWGLATVGRCYWSLFACQTAILWLKLIAVTVALSVKLSVFPAVDRVNIVLVGVCLLWTVALVFASSLARFSLQPISQGKRQAIQERVQHTDLFSQPHFPEDTGWQRQSLLRITLGFSTLLKDAGVALFPSAFFVLLCRHRPKVDGEISWWLVPAAFVVILVFVLYLARSSQRLETTFNVFRHLFGCGTPALVSYSVIALAIAKQFENNYVMTVADGSPELIWKWVVAAYLVFWGFDYWLNRILNDELLLLLAKDRLGEYRVKYPCRSWVRIHHVEEKDRTIQLHGGRRFAVVGTAMQEPREWSKLRGIVRWVRLRRGRWTALQFLMDGVLRLCAGKVRWQFYDRDELFVAVVQDANLTSRALVAAEDARGRMDPATALARRAVARDPSRPAHDPTQFDRVQRRLTSEPGRLTREDARLLGEVRLASATYFAFFNVVLTLAFTFVGWRAGVASSFRLNASQTPRIPFLAATDPRGELYDVRGKLFGDQKPEGGYPQIMPGRILAIASSGGGTRAALNTLEVLEGLRRIDALKDVKLVSGVSGGAVALAYYAAHAESLNVSETVGEGPSQSGPKEQADPWQRFHEAMAYDYITQVLAGSTDLEVLVRGTPIGELLGRSLREQFNAAADPKRHDWTSRPAAAEVEKYHPLVILNSTLAGIHESPTGVSNPGSAENESGRRPYLAPHEPVKSAQAYQAGSRLVFTNFRDDKYFDRKVPDLAIPAPACLAAIELPPPSDDYLRFVTIAEPGIELATAASLCANFPPVFQNAYLQFQDKSAWVTDGGAMDNRGLISILLLLERIIEKESAERETGGLPRVEKWPEIDVIVADASYLAFDYANDRGVTAALSAKAQLANELIRRLTQQVTNSYKNLQQKSAVGEPSPLKILYLPMPSPLRSFGGMGTHWMVQSSVTIKPPRVRQNWRPVSGDASPPGSYDPATLNHAQVRQLIHDLYCRPASYQPQGVELQKVYGWCQEDPFSDFHERWSALRRYLKRDAAVP
ncbi:MAG: patatin-like phospholipase family protein [Planctomycetota bacterium]|nr:patatin-like phospholipase family protein [Planctomycetota bacterium]